MLDTNKTKNFAAAIRQGCTYEAGASAIGVIVMTVYHWLRLGKKATRKNDKYLKFLKAVKKAEHERQQHLLNQILAASNKDWKAAAWKLERRWGYNKEGAAAEEQPKPVEAIGTDTLQILREQALGLKTRIAKAETAQSWQSYAALQSQFLNVQSLYYHLQF